MGLAGGGRKLSYGALARFIADASGVQGEAAINRFTSMVLEGAGGRSAIAVIFAACQLFACCSVVQYPEAETSF